MAAAVRGAVWQLIVIHRYSSFMHDEMKPAAYAASGSAVENSIEAGAIAIKISMLQTEAPCMKQYIGIR